MANFYYLKFTGMCSFVPYEDKLIILLPDARESHGVTGHHPHYPHYAVLDFSYEEFSVSPGCRDPLVYYTREGLRRGIFFLERDDFWLKSNGDDVSNKSSLSIPEGKAYCCCPDKKNYSYLSWIAPLNVVSPGAGIVDYNCLGPWSRVHDVAARFRIDNASAEVTSFSGFGQKVIKWHFEDLKGELTHSQALGDEVSVKRAMSDNNEISFDVGCGKTPVVLKAASLEGAARREIYIKNLPLDDILDIRPRVIYPGVEHHFAHHFRLCDQESPAIVVPVFRRDFCDYVPPNVGSPKCPPALFAPP